MRCATPLPLYLILDCHPEALSHNGEEELHHWHVIVVSPLTQEISENPNLEIDYERSVEGEAMELAR